jgi:hypothetical protein
MMIVMMMMMTTTTTMTTTRLMVFLDVVLCRWDRFSVPKEHTFITVNVQWSKAPQQFKMDICILYSAVVVSEKQL